jgi:hypothetical protein
MNLFFLFLVGNSILILGFILNQNETTKDSTKTNVSPFEKPTWIGLFFQFFLLLIQTKLVDP